VRNRAPESPPEAGSHAAPATAAPHWPAELEIMIGTTVLHYRIVAELGAGAMGRVYLARDDITERRVALKFVEPGLTEAGEARDRMIREARAAARLSHRGIVTLFGVEQDGGQLFLVQEYVEGETLGRRLSRGPLGEEEVLRLARDLGDALAHAHSNGVIHRDLKPENILIAADGGFKIADFGIARLEGAATLTVPGTLLGSLPYMAPERMSGAQGGPRADLFALGAILYEALSGRRAFPGPTATEVLYQVMNTDPEPLSDGSPTFAALSALIVRLIMKDPEERPEDARAVLDVLGPAGEAALPPTGQAVVRPATRTARRAAAAPRSWSLRWVWGALAVLLVLLAAFAGWRLRGRGVGVAPRAPTLAVLYFDNILDPGDGAKMGAITSNLLITSLAQVAELNVLSSERILEVLHRLQAGTGAANRAVALKAAKLAGATRIVTGSILQVAPRIVMTVEVSDASSGRLLHAERCEGAPGQSVFEVVDALGGRLMNQMAPAGETIQLQPVADRAIHDLEAYRSYVRGLEYFARGDEDRAIQAFRDAVARQPQFAQANYQLAIANWRRYEMGFGGENLEVARAHQSRLTPRERGVVAGLTSLLHDQYGAAADSFARLARAYPGDRTILYGLLESAFHHRDYAGTVAAAHQAIALDPDFNVVGGHWVDALGQLGRYREGEGVARRVLAKNPRNERVWLSLFDLELLRGEREAALAAAKQARAAGAISYSMRSAVAGLLLTGGDAAGARSWMAMEGGAPSWIAGERMEFDYRTALFEGRFRDAERIATRAWDDAPSTTLPVADGVQAGIGCRDTARTLEWADSVAARKVRALGPTALVDGARARFAAQVGLGLASVAAAEVQKIRSLPGKRSEYEEIALQFMQAQLLRLQGKPEEALRTLEAAYGNGVRYYWFTKARLERVRDQMALGLHAQALAQLDTLMRAPVYLEEDDAARLRLHRGRILEALKRPAEATASYRDFLRVWKSADPATPEVVEARAALVRLGDPARREQN
jgi:serine/threonine-protein kinase